jgi:hypothetical protein
MRQTTPANLCCAFILAVQVCFTPFIFSECPFRDDISLTVDRFFTSFVEKIKNENLVLVTKSVDIECCKIKQIGLFFDSYQHPDIPVARKLMMDVASYFLLELNRDTKLRPFLHCPPFTEKNIVIRIHFRPKQCGFYFPKLENVAHISLIDGMVSYETLNSYNFTLKNLRRETFAQAMQIVAREF